MLSRTKNAGLSRTITAASSRLSSSTAPVAPVGPHERQSRPRKQSLPQAREEAGETLSLLSKVVKATVEHGQPLTGRSQTQQRSQRVQHSGDGASNLGRSLLNARRAAGANARQGGNDSTDPDAVLIRSSRYPPNEGARGGRRSETSYSVPPSSRSGQREYARPRGNNRDGQPRQAGQRPPSFQGGPRSPRQHQANRRPGRDANRSSTTPHANVSPLVMPSKVAYPSLNLESMLRQDLQSSTAHLKQATTDVEQDAQTNSSSHEAKLEEALGDYSRWEAPKTPVDVKGQSAARTKGPGQVMQRAALTLAGNATVGLKGRKEFLDKLETLLKQ
ncbi:hypothetical protein ACM66B_001275 [Microbotryomycetes sp. NB124-2]